MDGTCGGGQARGDQGGGQGGHRGPPQGPQRGPSDGEPKGGPRDKSPSSSAENTHCNPALTQASLGRRPQPVAGPGEREAGERGTPLAGVTGQFPANWRSTSLSSPARSGSRILHRRGTACSTHAPAAELPAWGGSTNRAGRQHSARIKDRPSGRQSATDKYTEGERSSASPPHRCIGQLPIACNHGAANPQTRRGRGAPPRLSHGSREPMGERRSPSTSQGSGISHPPWGIGEIPHGRDVPRSCQHSPRPGLVNSRLHGGYPRGGIIYNI